MAVTSHELHWKGATGGIALARGSQYTAVIRVFTDDAQDQAQTILLYVQANVAALGSLYAYANDTASTTARLRNIRAERVMGHDKVWEAILEYSTEEDEEEQQDEDGNPTDDPLEFRPRIRISTAQYTKPVERARIISGFVGTAAALWPQFTVVGPAINSAGVPFNPPLEEEDSQFDITIERNKATVDGSHHRLYRNTVNLENFQINKFGYSGQFFKYEGRIRGIALALRRQNGVDFWEEAWTIAINRELWRPEVVDRGIAARAAAGDPDGEGSFISPGDIVQGVPQIRRLVDAEGNPINEPVLFNGDGQPLAPGGAPVFLRYSHYPELSYQSIPFFDGIIT